MKQIWPAAAVTALLVITLAGCGSGAAVSTKDGKAVIDPKGDVTVKTDKGETTYKSNGDGGVTMEGKTDDGQSVKFQSGTSLPEGFDKNIPLPKDAKIDSSVSTATDTEAGYVVTFTTGKAPKDLAESYRGYLKSTELKVSELTSDDTIIMTAADDAGTKSYMISIQPNSTDSGKSDVMITYGNKK